ncbi:MAG: SAM-dependent methyltransferase [Proteobacteria bacterium]|nr:SAM-dependent methyltransferase [Pseudomonadota bacterium]
MLPPLSEDEQRHCDALAGLIRAAVQAAGGWLSFERFMDMALYAPGLGYYSAGARKLGPGGDFVTAPQMSALFSRCLARSCAGILRAAGGQVLELGAGTGRMAADLLRELELLGVLPERYAILEVSAELAQRQRQLLGALPPRLAGRVEWLDRLPQTFAGIVLANEVADALPCRRFLSAGGAVRELGVSLGTGGEFLERDAPADAALTAAYAQLVAELGTALPEGYRSELSLRVGPWVASLADCLGRGALLLFDYGLTQRHYYHPQRTHGTLRCHFRQRAHDDPYVNVGVQDITAWVDFTRVAHAAVAAGLELAGFATQAAFLLATGIEERVAEADGEVERARLSGEARRLIMPEEMGEAFKVMALTRGLDAPPEGFALQDLRDRL